MFYPNSNIRQDASVRDLEIQNPGSGHTDGTFQLLVDCNPPSFAGTEFSATYTVMGEQVVSANVVNRGSGYTGLGPGSAPVVRTNACDSVDVASGCTRAILSTRVPRYVCVCRSQHTGTHRRAREYILTYTHTHTEERCLRCFRQLCKSRD